MPEEQIKKNLRRIMNRYFLETANIDTTYKKLKRA